MPATKVHPACTFHEDGMWLPYIFHWRSVKNFNVHVLKLLSRFEWNPVSCHNLFLLWKLILYFVQYLRERTLLMWFYKNTWLTLSCVRTVVNRFVSNLIWCQTWPKLTVWCQFERPWWLLKLGYMVTGKLEHGLSFCCKVAWSDSNVHDGWLCMGYDYKEVLWGECRKFKHLLFLFVCLFCFI